jgi:hydroxyacyl-ACP dehydratase HTD2-like protein with hotdog domain
MSSTVAYIDSLNNERESFPDSEGGDSRAVTVPPGWHLSYFTPGQPLGELGIDGTDTSYNPDMPYTRRMWAGGSVEWPGADPTFENERGKLKLGWTATESTRVLSCTPKTIKKTGETMLVVGVEKEYLDEIGYQAVIEKRNWIFRRAFDLSKPAPPIPPRPALLDNAALEKLSKNKLVRKFCRTTAELFRFSALTFNGHRIHYDREWAQQVEGHRNIVVHGPLNMVSILDFWRHAQSKKEMAFPKKLDYRATSAIYVDEPYRILIDADTASKKVTDVQVISDDGTICMTAQITNW